MGSNALKGGCGNAGASPMRVPATLAGRPTTQPNGCDLGPTARHMERTELHSGPVMSASGMRRKRRTESLRRMVLMPDPSFPGSWIPDPERRKKLAGVAAAVVHLLTQRPGIGVRQLRAGVRGLLGRCTDADTDAALYVLREAVDLTSGTRGAYDYRVDVEKVPADVRARLATFAFASQS